MQLKFLKYICKALAYLAISFDMFRQISMVSLMEIVSLVVHLFKKSCLGSSYYPYTVF